jgi:phosphoribosylformylglycinamidine (FGAM) synthase PurS component
VAKIVVDVMLKPEIHDPQGEAIAGACHRLGFTEVVAVRQGKRFEVEIADAVDTAHSGDEGAAHGQGGQAPPSPADLEARVIRVAELAAELLANPIIEEFAIHAV